MKIFLDDLRKPEECFEYMKSRVGNGVYFYTLNQWIIVRGYEQFCEALRVLHECSTKVELISLDHDLASEHYPTEEDDTVDYDRYTEKTGKDCAEFLVQYYKDHNLSFPRVFIHSMNPVGLVNIKNVLEPEKIKINDLK